MDGRTTSSDWHAIDRRHRAGILLGAAVVLAVIATGVVVLTDREPGVPGGETSRTITPAEQTAEATIPAPSYDATTSGEPSSTAGSGDAAAAASQAPTSVAYRRDGWLCVAALDGGEEQRIAESGSGVFSLSPDGETIASVDSDGHLRLYDVTTGAARDLGPGERDRPSWSPDSEWVVYTALGSTVKRYARRGGHQTILFEGRAPVVARDGVTVVAASLDAREPAILIWRDDRLERRATDALVMSVACTTSRVYVGTAPGASGRATLRSMSLSESDERIEAQSVGAVRSVSIGSVLVSPDEAWVAYAECGDDGHSRVYVVPVSGGTPVLLSGRRDAYPLQWAGADTLLLIEGNAMQGESTALVSASIAGGVRELVVEGAGR